MTEQERTVFQILIRRALRTENPWMTISHEQRDKEELELMRIVEDL